MSAELGAGMPIELRQAAKLQIATVLDKYDLFGLADVAKSTKAQFRLISGAVLAVKSGAHSNQSRFYVKKHDGYLSTHLNPITEGGGLVVESTARYLVAPSTRLDMVTTVVSTLGASPLVLAGSSTRLMTIQATPGREQLQLFASYQFGDQKPLYSLADGRKFWSLTEPAFRELFSAWALNYLFTANWDTPKLGSPIIKHPAEV